MAKLHGNDRGANLSHQCTPFKTIQMTSHGENGNKCPDEDSFKTIHQKSGKSVLSRPSNDGSRDDTSFRTMDENYQKSTSFKTIELKTLTPDTWSPLMR